MFNYKKLYEGYFVIQYKNEMASINFLTVRIVKGAFNININKIIADIKRFNGNLNEWEGIIFDNEKDALLYIELLESYETIYKLSM